MSKVTQLSEVLKQAYCLISVAMNLGISQAAGVLNVIVSAFLPLDIFGG